MLKDISKIIEKFTKVPQITLKAISVGYFKTKITKNLVQNYKKN
jgi:hypothetical protein